MESRNEPEIRPDHAGLAAIIALVARYRRYLLLALLVLLHLAIVQGVPSAVARTLLVGHFGLFLLWQPIVRAERRLGPLELALLATAVTAFIIFLNGWLMIAWTMVLTAIVGGKVFFYGSRWSRLFYLLALGYLLVLMLVLLLPPLLPMSGQLPGGFDLVARYVLPLMFPLMAILPVEDSERDEAQVVDLFSGIILFLLLAVLMLGCLAFMLVRAAGYAESLLLTLLSLAALLLLLGWAWNPRAGFSGLGVLFSRHVLSVGLPFEQWMHHLAEHAMREDDPAAFLDDAFAGLARLPWVGGGEWRAGERAEDRSGRFGRLEGQKTEYHHGPLAVTLYTSQRLSPALSWHFGLLARLLGEFYLAKVHAAQLQRLSYVEAVHETGARVTHDVKNLLQSLNTLCFAAEWQDGDNSAEFQRLLRRQLPVITQRLQQTLDKLRRPEEQPMTWQGAASWWADLKQRYAGAAIDFTEGGIDPALEVPGGLFNSVAENLLQNALDKRLHEPALRISARFSGGGAIEFSVCDSGSPIAGDLAVKLLRGPVESAGGFGIGLYQSARQAEGAGYRLELQTNQAGHVCFRLHRRQPAA